MCDYKDAYIIVKKTIDLLAAAVANQVDETEKNVAFKNNASFRSCIPKINDTLEEDLDIVKSMYILL